jgi:hypothetical protein
MRKGPGNVYDKWKISVVIWDIYSVASSIKKILIGTTSFGISYQLREIYSTCRYCWNVAIYKWKVHNGK